MDRHALNVSALVFGLVFLLAGLAGLSESTVGLDTVWLWPISLILLGVWRPGGGVAPGPRFGVRSSG